MFAHAKLYNSIVRALVSSNLQVSTKGLSRVEKGRRAQNHVTCFSSLRLDSTLPTRCYSSTSRQVKEQSELHEEREQLTQQAKGLTLSLFRACLKSAKILKSCNPRDEENFRKREDERLEKLSDDLSSLGGISFTPPIDRENELISRAMYYSQYASESFHQDSDCLMNDPWKEVDIEKYVYLMRQGNDYRKWVLDDNLFEDDVNWDIKHLDEWECRAKNHVRVIYEANGWALSSEMDIDGTLSDDDDDFWDDDDDKR